MTQRERVLATGLGVMVLVLGGGLAFHLLVWQPLSEVRDQMRTAQTQVTKRQGEVLAEQKQISGVLDLNPRLTQWQKISLPPASPLYELSTKLPTIEGLKVTDLRNKPTSAAAGAGQVIEIRGEAKTDGKRRPELDLVEWLKKQGWLGANAKVKQMAPGSKEAKEYLDKVGKKAFGFLFQQPGLLVPASPSGSYKFDLRFGLAHRPRRPGVTADVVKKEHLDQLQVDYERFLSELARKSGFQPDSIKVHPRQPDRKSAPAGKGKEPVYERLAFGVEGTGRMENVVRLMKEFHTTPLLHQIRSLTLLTANQRTRTTSTTPGGAATPVPPGTLTLNLTVEALLVGGAEARTALLPAGLPYQPKVLSTAQPGRRYEDMVVKNMFTGYQPPRSSSEPRFTVEQRNEILRWIKLTTLSYDTESRRWRGYFYNQAKGPRKDEEKNVKWEDRVDARLFKEITITDKNDQTVFEAEVVYVDEGQLVIKAEGKYYRLRCGEFLYPAVREPLSNRELQVLGIEAES